MYGQIKNFPIGLVHKIATSGEMGICPALSGNVHFNLDDCDKNAPVSERAINDAINIVNAASVSFNNIGEGYHITHHTEANTGYFNMFSAGDYTVLSGQASEMPENYLEIGFENDTVIFKSTVPPEYITTPIISDEVATDVPLSVQGGALQHYSEVSLASGDVTIRNANIDDLMGKIQVKILDPITERLAYYSIGFDDDKEHFVKTTQITSNAEGYSAFEYGQGLKKEYSLIDSQSKQEIKLFTYGNAAQTKLGITMWYDEVKWHANAAYAFGTSESDTFKYNLDNDTVQPSSRNFNIYSDTMAYTVAGNNKIIYAIGGSNSDLSTVYASINKFDTTNDTTNLINDGALSEPLMNSSAVFNNNILYTMGGQNSTGKVDNIHKIENNTSSIIGAKLPSQLSSVAAVNTIIAGGLDASNNPVNTIHHFNNDTIINMISTLVEPRGQYLHNTHDTNDCILLHPENNTNNISKIYKLIDVVVDIPSVLGNYVGSSCQTVNVGYSIGQFVDGAPINTIIKTDFTNMTQSFVNVASQELKGQSANG